MPHPLVTVAVVPRERFSFAVHSLATLLERTEAAYDLLYVDGNSPPAVRRDLERLTAHRQCEFIHTDCYLSPNVARNLAAQRVRTRYVAFVDNDVVVSPQWLERLLACAEETDAWAVGPLYCQGLPESSIIHMAGGVAHFYESQGRRFFREQHSLCGKPVDEHRAHLKRSPVELLEYHGALVRMKVFERFGPLDENYLSVHEHVDLCLTLRQAGLGVWMEPQSVITYVGPLPLSADDRPYFSLRWSEAWNRLSMDHFQAKWDVASGDPGTAAVLTWAANHRAKAHQRWRDLLRPLGRKRAARLVLQGAAQWSRRRYTLPLCAPGGAYDGGRGRLHSAPDDSPTTSVRRAA